MFTGIIEETAVLRSIHEDRMWLDVSFAAELQIGQSVACSGVCLTVVEQDERGFAAEVMEETWSVTALSDLQPGDLVNVERAMSAQGRFDGHIVQGHVDGVAELVDISEQDGESWLLTFQMPDSLSNYVVQKGSITIDGISLTVVSCDGGLVKVGIIPHTWQMTHLHRKSVGSRLHIEVDVLAKYVEKMLSPSS